MRSQNNGELNENNVNTKLQKENPMEWHPVDSSQIQSVAHDPETKTLHVKFHHGDSIYQYTGVTPEIFANLKGAESVGKHFNAHIRNNFPFKKI